MVSSQYSTASLRSGYPEFTDLPWDHPIEEWAGCCTRLEDVPQGLSRHPVVFVNYDGAIFALKELPVNLGQREYEMLSRLEEHHFPAVIPVGYVIPRARESRSSILITRYLDRSLPYRLIFMQNKLVQYRVNLQDALAGLLVQLHLLGIFWGDCSLSNVLFRRDANMLRAYLVDAETAEVYHPPLLPALRHQDLQIMEENVTGDLYDLASAGLLPNQFPLVDTGAYIRQGYQRLWEEVTREEIIKKDEYYRIQERIRILNDMGFSVGDVELLPSGDGEKMHFHFVVTDRNFHRNQLHELTGLEVEEMQARNMMNEIQELRAILAQRHNRSMPLSTAAYYWLERIYLPIVNKLAGMYNHLISPAEFYCHVLEHKWYLSEQAHHDVGHENAADDYIRRYQDTISTEED